MMKLTNTSIAIILLANSIAINAYADNSQPSNDVSLSETSRACVTLPVGVGYAATIYITADDGFKSKTTTKFNLGETKCIDTSNISDDSEVTVHVIPMLATASAEITCEPKFNKKLGQTILYQASGPLWAAWCQKV